ncbi:MAG: single-stranded DNA-binding protein [Alphaproteobacteria bacterium]|nr:single-stranded DNA-binding protein [Alphaproteobacteria bacterium]
MMAGYLNKVQLIGNLGRDPEVRNTQDGSKVVSLAVATTEYWRDKTTNERRERTEWHRVVIFNDKICEIAEKYLRKGSKVYLEGQLQTRKWTDNAGQERYTTEIVLQRFRGELMMMDSKGGDASMDPSMDAFSDSSFSGQSFPSSSPPLTNDLDDEIPF